MVRRAKKKESARARPRPSWASLSDEELLDLRFCDLGLSIEGTPLEARVSRLNHELAERGLAFQPHFWLSTEWFSPDGVPGIALPFYLAHPRLRRLEERQILDVEGGTPRWCMQLLRHEAGHALDSAYRLHRKKTWRELFGNYSAPYTTFYQPKPYSKSYVQHLDYWYAQSHPAEDWAETFAVWLDPASRWRRRYRGWRALRKLEYVDGLMRDLSGKKPLVRSRERVEPLNRVRRTLREHYARKKKRYGVDYPSFYDNDIRRLFPEGEDGARGRPAAAVLRRMRPELRRAVARWTGVYQYAIDQVLLEMIQRCDELKIRTVRDEDAVKPEAMLLLSVQTMNYLHGGRHRLAR